MIKKIEKFLSAAFELVGGYVVLLMGYATLVDDEPTIGKLSFFCGLAFFFLVFTINSMHNKLDRIIKKLGIPEDENENTSEDE